jgi:hypothetical protein
MNPDSLDPLRLALEVSPDNLPLRRHLAESLLAAGQLDEAEQVCRDGLATAPADRPLRLLLASTFFRQGKHDQALVLLEDLTERLGVDAPAAAPPADGPADRPAITFAEVGGMEGVKEEIRVKVIHPLAHPDLYRAYGKPIGGGILLYGPPGCGKTHLARATAGEAGVGFVAVGIDQVLDLWLGSSERNLHALFQQARANRPCVLFFDEVDALGASRAELRAGGGRHLLAATNAPWYLDTAFRRPGRFDRVLFVPPPDAPARAAILRILCRDKPIAGVDYDQLAGRTAGLSGADLKAMVDLAVEAKLREAIRDGLPRPLTAKDLTEAARRVKPSTREWFANARNYAAFANQGGLYDDLLPYLEGR